MSEISADELKALIDRTYEVENEYIALRKSYDDLNLTIDNLIGFLPNAIWVLNSDNSVFLQNSKANELSKLFSTIKFEDKDYELNFKERSYIIKSSQYNDKHIVSATDITEQKRKENLATMGQMAAHLSHEIRNPIGSISLLASALMKKVKVENKPIVLEVRKSVYRIERIIKATLMFSKGIMPTIETINWSDIKESLDTAIGYYSYGSDIEFIFDESDFELNGDLDLLSMMFSNFVFNAIDAIELDDKESGFVKIEHKQSDEFHEFYIYDSGIAIEKPKELFSAFKSTKEKGNGLGLILSQQIANAHGGDVILENGNKKCFKISLKK